MVSWSLVRVVVRQGFYCTMIGRYRYNYRFDVIVFPERFSILSDFRHFAISIVENERILNRIQIHDPLSSYLNTKNCRYYRVKYYANYEANEANDVEINRKIILKCLKKVTKKSYA